MNIALTNNHLSLTPFEWNDVPSFAVLTGRNGCGKTQLLSTIYDVCRKHATRAWLKIDGIVPGPGASLFLNSEFLKMEASTDDYNRAKIESGNSSLWSEFTKAREKSPSTQLVQYAERKLGVPAKEISSNEFLARVSPFWNQSPEDIFGGRVSRRFRQYEIAKFKKWSEGKTRDEALAELGDPPWVWMNELLRDVGLPFQFESPDDKIGMHFEFRVKHDVTSSPVKLSELSQGERALLTLCFWVFNSKDSARFPKLLLLDEPDAHLHPAVVKNLVDVLNNVLAEKYGIRVLMTTHRPTTIQFVPDASLFEMRRENDLKIVPVSKANACHLLTAGLVSVLPAVKTVLVEDEDDAQFYTATARQLAYQGHISTDHPLQFKPVGRKRTSDESGGRTVVEKWVGILSADDSPMSSLVCGLVDNDNKVTAVARVHQIGRYCFENYLIDPIVVFHRLVESGNSPALVTHVPANSISGLPAEQLQQIADHIISECETHSPELREGDLAIREPVAFANGNTLSYPKWLISKSGKDLLSKVMGPKFDQRFVNKSHLMKSFDALGLIPLDLANLMRKIQAPAAESTPKPQQLAMVEEKLFPQVAEIKRQV